MMVWRTNFLLRHGKFWVSMLVLQGCKWICIRGGFFPKQIWWMFFPLLPSRSRFFLDAFQVVQICVHAGSAERPQLWHQQVQSGMVQVPVVAMEKLLVDHQKVFPNGNIQDTSFCWFKQLHQLWWLLMVLCWQSNTKVLILLDAQVLMTSCRRHVASDHPFPAGRNRWGWDLLMPTNDVGPRIGVKPRSQISLRNRVESKPNPGNQYLPRTEMSHEPWSWLEKTLCSILPMT